MTKINYENPAPGIYYNIPEKDYHEKLNLLSKSKLSKFAANPMKAEEPFATTKAMEIGSAIHCKILTPNDWNNLFAVGLDIDKRSKANKLLHEEFELKNEGKTIIAPKDYVNVKGAVDAINGNDIAIGWLKKSINREVTIIDEIDGIKTKCRLDCLNVNDIIDLKKTVDGTPAEFARTIVKYKYHWQAAIYIDMLSGQMQNKQSFTWHFIVVEEMPPYCVYTYILDDEAIEQGRYEYRQALKAYKEYVENDKIIKSEIKTISLPAWAKTKFEFNGMKIEEVII